MLAPGYCWIFAAPYALTLRKHSDSKNLYDSWEEIYRVNYGEKTNESGIRLGNLACASKDMADWLTRKSREKNPGAAALLMGEMTGYASSAEGFPAILQPALAVAVDAAVPDAEMAWQKYLQRSVKQDYGQEPQFAVVPRKVTKK